jgi:nucleoside-diphosphate-sugar epimerase
MQKIFVTGATGFIGSSFIDTLEKENYDYVALCRSIPSRNSSCGKWIRGGLKDVKADDFSGCDTLVHLAASGVDQAVSDWGDCFEVNVIQSVALWRKAIAAGISNLVICGSCFEYGVSGQKHEKIPADAALFPTGAYHASKAAASMYAIGLAYEKKISLQLLRPFQVYGVGEKENRFWPSLLSAAEDGRDFEMTAGEQIRDFTPVSSVAAEFLKSCVNPHEGILIQNIGTGMAQSLKDFAEQWWNDCSANGKLTTGALSYRKGEVMRYVPDCRPFILK